MSSQRYSFKEWFGDGIERSSINPSMEPWNQQADDWRLEPRPQHEPRRTPLTPASPWALMLLLGMIKEVPEGDDAKRRHKQRLQQKVNNAA